MSGIPTNKTPYEVLNNVDWREEFSFATTVNGVSTPDDFTGAEIYGAVWVRIKGRLFEAKFATSTGEIELTTAGAFVVTLNRSVMLTLPPALYDGDLRITRAGDVDDTLLKFKLVVGEGRS